MTSHQSLSRCCRKRHCKRQARDGRLPATNSLLERYGQASPGLPTRHAPCIELNQGAFVTIRIDHRQAEGGAIIELHGWLLADAVPEFESLCDSASGCLRIHLSNLVGADEDGVRALRRRIAGGARIVEASPYIALLLQGGD